MTLYGIAIIIGGLFILVLAAIQQDKEETGKAITATILGCSALYAGWGLLFANNELSNWILTLLA